ncbi:MAG: hypothetical protein NTW87_19615 [Planctomycetota bacterium]|nr:hypothetical protein [Planctomycetota bacterium]
MQTVARRVVCLSAVLLGALAATAAAGEPGASPLFDVPKLDGITIDGKADDWGDRGFRVDALTDVLGKVLPAKNYNAVFRLGWEDKGLLVLVTVTDDVFLEPATKPEELWKADSVEVFMATERGSTDSYQAVIAPGMDPNNTNVRMNISDYRKTAELKKSAKLELTCERTKTDGGYTLEILMPWKNLGIEPQEGKEVAFQLYANDLDKEGGERFQLLWYPVPEANTDTFRMHRIRLAAKPSPPIKIAVTGAYDAEGRGQLSVVSTADLKGKQLKVKDGEKSVGKGKLEADGGRAAVKIELSKPKDKVYGPLTVTLDDEVLATVTLPQPATK